MNQQKSENPTPDDKPEKPFYCMECGGEKTVFELSPAVIDDTLKLVCASCWDNAVKEERATIFTKEELSFP